MSVGLYMDVHAPAAVTRGLRLRQVDVLTAQADGRGRASDPALLDRAMELGRVLFSRTETYWRRPSNGSEMGNRSWG